MIYVLTFFIFFLTGCDNSINLDKKNYLDIDIEPHWMPYYPKSLDEPDANEFTIVAFPDTQSYYDRNDRQGYILEAQIDWVLNNLSSQNIRHITHVGDMTEDNLIEEWNWFNQQWSRFDGLISYGLSIGNHDYVMRDQNGKWVDSLEDASLFQSYFPASRFHKYPWFGGSFKNNTASFQYIDTGFPDIKILSINLQCTPKDDELKWTSNVILNHPNHRVMITTHQYLGPVDFPKEKSDISKIPKGRMKWNKCNGNKGNSPEKIFHKLIRKHPNIFLVISGDQRNTESFVQTSAGEAENVVHEIMNDIRSGFIRILRFNVATDEIKAILYTNTPEANKCNKNNKDKISRGCLTDEAHSNFILKGWK
jgi:hypothetical protein